MGSHAQRKFVSFISVIAVVQDLLAVRYIGFVSPANFLWPRVSSEHCMTFLGTGDVPNRPLLLFWFPPLSCIAQLFQGLAMCPILGSFCPGSHICWYWLSNAVQRVSQLGTVNFCHHDLVVTMRSE